MRYRQLIGFTAVLASSAAVGQDAVTKPQVKGNPAEYFGYDNYPPDARQAGESGRVSVLLSISAEGRVTDCVVKTSASASLDAATCRIATTRIAFEPGRGATGKAVASTYLMSVAWRLDSGATGPVEVTKATFPPNVMEAEIVVDERGRVASCRMSEGQSAGDMCSGYPVGKVMAPGFVRNGKPIRAIMRPRFVITTEFLP